MARLAGQCMTAYADYTDLRIAVAERVGNRDISDVLDRFTLAAEAWFNREVRCQDQIKSATITFTDGTAPVPSDCIEVVRLLDANASPMATSYGSASGDYFVAGSSLTLANADGPRAIEYYAALPSLTTSLTASNWLLQKSPDLYEGMVSLQAAKWLKDAELATALSTVVASEVSSLKWADVRSRYGASPIRRVGYGP